MWKPKLYGWLYRVTGHPPARDNWNFRPAINLQLEDDRKSCAFNTVYAERAVVRGGGPRVAPRLHDKNFFIKHSGGARLV